MTLLPSEYTKEMWDKDFKVTQTITLGDGKLRPPSRCGTPARRPSPSPAPSTYFAADIDESTGLKGCKSLDRLKDEAGTVAGALTMSGPVDSCYYDVPSVVVRRRRGNSVAIESQGD